MRRIKNYFVKWTEADEQGKLILCATLENNEITKEKIFKLFDEMAKKKSLENYFIQWDNATKKIKKL
mgnify:CR=1 FL=1